MANRPVQIVIAGIGGYGRMYVRHLLGNPLPESMREAVQIVGVADPEPARCDRYTAILDRGIPVYKTIEQFYARHSADLAIIATPVHLHGQHIRLALHHGSHVLAEKPLASSMKDVRDLLRLQQMQQRQVAVGYQWSWSNAVQSLRDDVAAGRLGRPIRFRTMVLWPRGDSYYARNNWAGRMISTGGLPVLDSPLNNACAHFVHNAFFILGGGSNSNAYPTELTAELYRARQIESYDTAAVRCTIGGDVEALFVASHAVPRRNGPIFRYEFENAVVSYDDSAESEGIVARFDDGTIKRYGVPGTSDNPAKIWDSVNAARHNRAPRCRIEDAAAQTAFACASHQSAEQIVDFPESLIDPYNDLSHGRIACVEGLDSTLLKCYETMRLPSETGVSWAVPSKRVRVDPLVPTSTVTNSAAARRAAEPALAGRVNGNQPHIEVTLLAAAQAKSNGSRRSISSPANEAI